jgi:FKBP-type peptidyl-prolyl cis-trans isomerase FklB
MEAQMKTYYLAGTLSALAACCVWADDQQVLKEDKQKISYSIGVSIGSNWKRQGVEVDLDALNKGIKDGLGGGATLLTEQEIRNTLTSYQQKLQAAQEGQRKQLAEKNKQEGEAFLAANKEKKGVVTLTNGLQYKIITEGAGETPKANDTVVVNYRGTLIDGTEFDNSAKRNEPATFPVRGVIKGWTEALQLMKAGSKWQLFIPSELAYGQVGRPPAIGPNATLLFDLELLSIKPPPPPPAPLTSDIIKVPSLEEMKKGAKIETIKAEDLEKLQKQSQPQQPQQPEKK